MEGWETWFRKINLDEAISIKNQINGFLQTSQTKNNSETLFLTYHIQGLLNKWFLINHELIFYKFKKKMLVLNYLNDVSQKERIEDFFGIRKSVPSKNLQNKVTISSREKEVLKLIAEGFSSKQIAEELFISNHTAISHRKHLIEKFGVKNTAQLIMKASKAVFL